MGILEAWMWVPAHKGNERADKLAKQALERQHKTDILLNKAEVKSTIKIKIIKGWQQARAQTFWGAGAQTKKKGHPLPQKEF